MQETPVPIPVVRLRPDAWRAWMEHLRLARVEDQAQYVGFSRAALYKILAGASVGEQFIAGCMARYAGQFEELFEIVEAS